ncbi:glycerophosphoryl diester phosphodiesterase [Vibrio sp. 10N.286.49.C2]|uniref:glycerophosphodiester phosphodiesterase family protein n=1 Tax=unclassified Vibrio TaxID=2614977 RepID=UPI000C8330EB|nr:MULTISPECIES: glycerophosphodiester phosphodiesterase family protein [unclassified Vibrio]PMH31633.1 glycerophosphoryl diester phosphodiesterase [Vibrio sp. 10N.286.49.C2]PMH50656.1 glycerophosphoryl diester phosphodiesterase [Vibrio sp. 10N.286.49.B1]PMH79323.1 glycerophosphoryl diester phosphodiesterase [Vibrio sp. 10N.286.48.B7]
MSAIIAGHRGVAGTHPENTLASIKEAQRLGVKWVEVDVQPSLDNALVICHDHTVDRCSNGSGRVDELTLSQLQQLDFGAWKAAQFKSEPILTLETLLSYCHENQLAINLEIKIDRHDAKHVVSLVKSAIDSSLIDRSQLLISSFSAEVMQELYAANLDVRLGVLGNRLNNKLLWLIDSIDAFSCHLSYRWLTQKHIRSLKTRNVSIWCYTVNNPKSFKHLQLVDGIFSDFPQRFSAQ